MKKSEITALSASVFGAVCAGALWYFFPVLPDWSYFVIAIAIGAGAYKTMIGIKADESVVDSETINRKP